MSDLRNRKNVLVGAPDVNASGGVMIGKPATYAQIPSSATGPLAAELAAAAAGYVSNDGVTKTVDRSTEKITDWFGDTIKVITSEHSVLLKLTLMESANANLLKSIYGVDNVKISKDGKRILLVDNADELPRNSWDFAIKGDEDTKIRVFAPEGQITSVGDVAFVKSDVIKYEVEIECFTDDNNGKCYQFIDRGDAAPSPDVAEEPAA